MLNKCPECGSPDLDVKMDLGECICRNCALVVDDAVIDHGQFREGTSVSKPLIKDGKIYKEHWALTAKEKNLYHAKSRLKWLEGKLNLPHYIEEQAFSMYAIAVERGLCVGRDNNSILLACLYASCTQNNVPKTAIEITDYSEIDDKYMLRAYKLLRQQLNIRVGIYDPIDMLPRFISRLGLSNQCLNKSIQIMERIKSTPYYSGKNPRSLIAAAIYIAAKLSNEKISQRIVANEVGVMEVTIRKRYKEIINFNKYPLSSAKSTYL